MDDDPVTEDATAGDLPSRTVRVPAQGGATGPIEIQEPDYSGLSMGDYRLVRRVAVGGMGAVYEAIQLKLDRKVALKILSGELESRPEFLQRFEREAKSAATLNHPNVVQVYDFGKAAGHYYLIMEFVEGEDLADYVSSKGKLGTAEALSVAEQTALALKAALEKSIIHRDIKPANLMRTTDGKIKVSDLGLAKKLNDTNTEVTATGVGIGSPHFLAPEQADDARCVDHRADMYALGITLLYLLTGRRPFEGGSAFSVIIAHANKPLPSGMDLGTELDPNVEKLIRRMAAKKPADRYADYDLLLADIERVKSGRPPSLPDGTVPEVRGQVRWLKPVLIGAGVALVIGLAILLGSHGPNPANTAVGPTNSLKAGDARGQGPGVGEPLDNDRGGPNQRPPPEAEARGRFPQPGPNGGARPGLGGYLPPPDEEPDFTPLKDGPADKMLAEADKYATDHPTEYMNIIRRYDQVYGKVAGTPREREIDDRAEKWRRRHQDAFRKEIDVYRARMEVLLAQGKRVEAQDIWRKFPVSLRNREVDTEIIQLLNARFGTSQPTPP